jgi:hypothetical protein
MKTLNITFTDGEYNKLRRAKAIAEEVRKGSVCWRKFILDKCCIGLRIK